MMRQIEQLNKQTTKIKALAAWSTTCARLPAGRHNITDFELISDVCVIKRWLQQIDKYGRWSIMASGCPAIFFLVYCTKIKEKITGFKLLLNFTSEGAVFDCLIRLEGLNQNCLQLVKVWLDQSPLLEEEKCVRFRCLEVFVPVKKMVALDCGSTLCPGHEAAILVSS